MKPPKNPITTAGDPIAVREEERLLDRRTHAHEALQQQPERAEEQRRAEDPARSPTWRPCRAVAHVGREPHAEQRHRRAGEEHPAGQARLHVPHPAVTHGADRLEDRAVRDVRARPRRSG